MDIDPRLDEIDDCLYRVAIKAFVVSGGRVLLVQEIPEMWWSFPGGGVDHGDTVEATVIRELVEELGVSSSDITTDNHVVHYTIGSVVNNIPRMNLFVKVHIPQGALHRTDQIAKWRWCTLEEFMSSKLSPSYTNRLELADIIFDSKA